MKLCVNSTLSLQISLVSSVLVRGLLFTGKNQNDWHAPDVKQGVCRKPKPHRQNEGFPNCTLKTEYREQKGQKNLSRTRTPAGETHFKIFCLLYTSMQLFSSASRSFSHRSCPFGAAPQPSARRLVPSAKAMYKSHRLVLGVRMRHSL